MACGVEDAAGLTVEVGAGVGTDAPPGLQEAGAPSVGVGAAPELEVTSGDTSRALTNKLPTVKLGKLRMRTLTPIN